MGMIHPADDLHVTLVSYMMGRSMSDYPTRDSSVEPDVLSDAMILGVSVKGHRHRPLPPLLSIAQILLIHQV